MEKAEIQELQRWGWECPACGQWHELDDDPAYIETVQCDACNNEFIAECV